MNLPQACIYNLVNTSLFKKSLVVTSVVKFIPLTLVFTFKYQALYLTSIRRLKLSTLKKDLYSQACEPFIGLMPELKESNRTKL